MFNFLILSTCTYIIIHVHVPCVIYLFAYKNMTDNIDFFYLCINFFIFIQKAPFKAQPLPDFGQVPDLPPKAPQHTIKLKPFNLLTEMRGEQHTVKQQEKVCECRSVVTYMWPY